MEKEERDIFSPNKFKKKAVSKVEAGKYLFANNQQDFSVHPLEEIIEHIPLPVYPHRNSVTQLFLVTEGKTLHTCGIDAYEVGADSILTIPQGYLTSIEYMQASVKGFYCHFDFSIFSAHLPENLQQSFPFLFTDEQPYLQLDRTTSAQLELIFRRLILEDSKARPNKALISSYLIAAFREMEVFLPEKNEQKFARNQKITNEFKELLYSEVKQRKSVKQYAEKLSISPNHLNKAVKASTGKTVKQLMTEALLLEAKNLLHQTDLSINDIAYELGMDDPAYFSRFFKQHTGHAPLDYRKMIEKSK